MDLIAPLLYRARELSLVVTDPHALTKALGDAVERFLHQTRWSFGDVAAPGLYHGRLLYEDPDTGFIAVAMCWGPGAATPIHDHGTWGVFGVTDGSLEFTNFQPVDEEGRVSEVARFVGDPGDVTWVVAPSMEIHRLHNPRPWVARSLHFYGRNIGF